MTEPEKSESWQGWGITGAIDVLFERVRQLSQNRPVAPSIADDEDFLFEYEKGKQDGNNANYSHTGEPYE